MSRVVLVSNRVLDLSKGTRETVEGYSDIRHELETLAGSINGRLGELDWVPIHYIYRSTPRRTLGDIYRSSRVCMVTPLRDGMNLIAKEYVAAQDAADPGVLILSKFAGAAEEMTEALIVNPYSIEETSDAIRAAPEMTLEERSERRGALLAEIKKHDAAAWSRSFLEHLKRVRSSDDSSSWHPPESHPTSAGTVVATNETRARPANFHGPYEKPAAN